MLCVSNYFVVMLITQKNPIDHTPVLEKIIQTEHCCVRYLYECKIHSYGKIFHIFNGTDCVSFFSAMAKRRKLRRNFNINPQDFYMRKNAQKCHTLERVFTEPKTENEWRICITRMMNKNKLWITEEEGAQIIDEIIGKRKDIVAAIPQKKKYADAQLLFIDRCTRCHTVSRILDKNKTRDEWVETIIRMRDNAPELFLDEDIPVIADFLTERGNIIRDDIAAQIMEEKCLVCHEAGRILLERKSKEGLGKVRCGYACTGKERF